MKMTSTVKTEPGVERLAFQLFTSKSHFSIQPRTGYPQVPFLRISLLYLAVARLRSSFVFANLAPCRSWTPLRYPLLDSFPQIYDRTPSPLSVRTALSTDSVVALRIKNLRNIVSRSIAVDERETLGNTLGEIAEAYEEGWDSGSDEDDD